MIHDLGLSLADMGIISGLGFQLAYALFQIPAGFVGDLFGFRIVLGLAIVGWGVASFATGIIPATMGAAAAFSTLFLVRVVLGITQAATFPVGSMAIALTVSPRRRATAISFFMAAALVGTGLAPLTLAPLMVRFGWRAVFVASGIVGFVTALAWFRFAPPTPPADPAHHILTLGQRLRDARDLLRERNLLVLSISYAMESAVFFVFAFWFFDYLVEGRGMTVLKSGYWGSIPWFVAALLAPFGGFLADTIGIRLTLAGGAGSWRWQAYSGPRRWL